MREKTRDPACRFSLRTIDDSGLEFKLKRILAPPGKKICLGRDYDPDYTGGFKGKEEAQQQLQANIEALAEQQSVLYASSSHGLLIILQALDAAGKDSVIKHVMSGVNPQGCRVTSFKVPSAEELAHDYLWRSSKALPERGMIGIFNRSYYEEVLVVRVHPEFLDRQKLPPEARGPDIWRRRFAEINAFEKYLAANGFLVLKFFLNLSRAEQKKRFLARIDEPDKNWKFSAADVQERRFWIDYQAAYEDCINHTSTEWAPWFIIPADHKWFTRLAVSEVIVRTLKGLKLEYPKLSKERQKELGKMRALLEKEK